MNEIYDMDEQTEEHARNSGVRLGELQSSIIAQHKKIAEIECPRDDSLDNCVVVWCSPAFAALASGPGSGAGSSTGTPGESSVPSICNILEDLGLTVRRCSDSDEAISRARDLQQESQLRCLIVGGDEGVGSCGPSCGINHNNTCTVCGNHWNSHNGHNCANGRRGSFPLGKTAAKVSIVPKVNTLQMFTALTDEESPYARANSALPALRTAVYSAHSSMKEDDRMAFWKFSISRKRFHRLFFKHALCHGLAACA